MKERKKADAKRKFAAILALFIAFVMVFSIVAPLLSVFAYAAPATVITTTEAKASTITLPKEVENERFSISPTLGFDNKYIVNKEVPFRFIVSNSSGKFKGEIQVKIHNQQYDPEVEPSYAIYYMPLELEGGSSTEVKFSTAVASIRNAFTVTLVDEKGNIEMVKNFPTIPKDPASVWTGVLSETPSSLVYLNQNNTILNGKSAIYDGVEYFDTFYLTESTFPTTKGVLDNFRVLIINNFNTQLLSLEQKTALSQWVEGGGNLVIGTGANANKVLKGMEDTFNFSYSQQTNTLPAGYLVNEEVTISDAELINGNTDSPLLQWSTVGSGKIILFSFDLGTAPFNDFVGANEIFMNLLETANSSIYLLTVGDSYNNYYTMESLAKRTIPQKGVLINAIYVFVIVYVLFIGPVLYFVLKKKDKREKGWVIIPTAAFATTAIIYLLGSGSYYRNSTLNTANLITLSENTPTAQAKVYGYIKSPKKGDITFTADEVFPLSVSLESNNYYSNNLTYKIKVDGTPNITYYNKATWDTNTFYSEKNIDLGGSLTPTLFVNNDTIHGTIENTTNMDFNDIVIKLGEEFILLGDCLAGQTLAVNYTIGESLINSNYSYYEAINNMFGLDYYVPNNTETFKKYSHAQFLRNSDYYSSVKNNSSNAPFKATIFAFNETPIIEGNKYVNNKKMNEQTSNYFVLNTAIAFDSNSKEIDLPFGFIQPSYITGTSLIELKQDSGYFYMDQQGYAYVTFLLPEEFNYTLFQVNWEVIWSMIDPPEILNSKTGLWEPLKGSEYNITADYIKDNTIILRANVENDRVTVPLLRLKGEAKK
ncbi:MAG: hypothetical protein ACRCW1_04650 [Anaerotignaceae bacterium]